jgi:hypothetical protein
MIVARVGIQGCRTLKKRIVATSGVDYVSMSVTTT